MATTRDAAFRRLDSEIAARMVAARTPAMAVALFDRERAMRTMSYGFRDPEVRAPLTPDTLFGIGSITKSFTGLAVVQAAEHGLLDLHRPVTDYLPWFEVQTRFAPITLHHLLTHTAGLVCVIDRSPDIRGAVWALRETEAAWPPGNRFHYSDAGYQVLTLVLQAVTGRPFAEVIRTSVFEPLRMPASVAAITHDVRPQLARGYCTLYDDRPADPSHPLVPAPWVEASSGDCSIASTAEEMAHYGRMLLNRGHGDDGAVISPASFERFAAPHVPAGTILGPQPCDCGYGLVSHRRDGFAHLETGGRFPGFVAHLIADMDHGISLATLSTTPHASGSHWPTMRLWRAAYLGEPLESTVPPPREPPPQPAEPAAAPAAAPTGSAELPAAWRAFPGHYRAHMPWEERNFRIVARERRLVLAWPKGNELPLTPRPGRPGAFWVGPEPTPEWIRFEDVAQGQALRATYSATPFYRFFTP